MQKISLKKKILSTIFISIAIAGALATYFVFIYAKIALEEKDKEIIVSESRQIAYSVKSALDQYGKTSDKFSKDLIKLDEDWSESEELIYKHFGISNHFAFIFLADKKGNIVSSTEEGFLGKNIEYHNYFLQALDQGRYESVEMEHEKGELNYYLAQSIKDEEDNPQGVVVVALDNNLFKDILGISNESNKTSFMLSDKQGLIVYSDNPENIIKSFGEINADTINELYKNEYFSEINIDSIRYNNVQEAINNKADERLLDSDDGNSLIMIRSIHDYPFFIVIEMEKEGVFGIAYALGLLVALAAISTAIFIYFSVSFQLRPLGKLHEMVVKASEGNYEVKMKKIEGSGEITDLVNAFNLMISSVKNSQSEINKKIEELENQKRAALNILEDVKSEKEKTEELARDLNKFKLAVENASDHIVITDPEGIILYANKAVSRITGFNNKEIVGKKAGGPELWGGLMSKKIYKDFWKKIKEKKEVFVGEFKNKRKNGEKYDAAASVGPVLDGNGEVLFFIGIERDITTEKEIDKTKTELISLASHQLRTPLTAVNWYTEMLLTKDVGKISKNQKKYLNEIYKESGRMTNLVNALLNVSRIDLGTFAVDPKEMEINKVADDSLKEFKSELKRKKIKINKLYDSKIGKIKIDPKLIEIVFQNIISNAIKYSPNNSQIDVEMKRGKKNIIIKISDSGIGIPKKQQSKIFDKLFRADNARKKETDGTGLGLYIVKSIIEDSGGLIWFESEENKGATFFIEIPLKGMRKKGGNRELTAEIW